MSLAVVHNTMPATRRRVDIREVVEELHRRFPRMGPERLAERLVERLEEDRHLLLNAGRFLVERIITAVETRQRQSRAAPTPAQRTARRAQEVAQVTKLVEKVREVAVLDMLMPNGKHMRFCTGEEMAAFGTAYSRIAERVGAAMVGEVMVEAEVCALLGSLKS